MFILLGYLFPEDQRQPTSPRVKDCQIFKVYLYFIKRRKDTFSTIPKGHFLKRLTLNKYDKVILPAKLLSIKGDEVYCLLYLHKTLPVCYS